MDRVKWASRLSIWSSITLLSAGLAAGSFAAAGTDFPDSAFGKPPAKPDLGIGNTYASHAVEEMDESSNGDDVVGARGNRAPAGLEFSDSAKPVGPRSERAAMRLPKTPTPADGTSPEPQPQNSTVRTGVQEVAVIASDLGFFPKTVFVTRDVPVRLFVTGASKNTLCLMMDSFQVRKQVRSQRIEEITFTPNVPGRYRFYCPVNGMEGMLIVKELATEVAAIGAR